MTYKSLIQRCFNNIKNDIIKTPLVYNSRLSDIYGANIYLKREDQQDVRSFKIRGALNKIKSIKNISNKTRIITASAGNHAQGVAYSCYKLNLNGIIYLPSTTPLQKINRIKYFGNDNINIKISGYTFNESLEESLKEVKDNDIFIHPYDDVDVINGQATIGYEIHKDINKDINKDIDYVLCAVGGGGLISGVGKYFKSISDLTNIIGVEPLGAESLYKSLKENNRVILNNIDTFVDGASVSQIGKVNYDICKNVVDKTYTVSNSRICHELVNFYQNEGIILEPAGVLSVCGLDYLDKESIKNKNIVCILSGGNNDIMRYQEIMELNLQYLDLRHYFLLKFIQKPGELKRFISKILGPYDDIIRFEYIKTTNKQVGDVLVGIELTNKEDIDNILINLNKYSIKYQKINSNDLVYNLLV